ncbi:ABC transporter ATP-binding protein [SAR202 cluster bacterium AC-647-N09_OGT_505m]|nr:ABC transporter ATP-binding protein [SAR202 cluster bacterium AC-647-N09_OGT_505m]
MNIKLSGVHFSYGSQPILKDVTTTIDSGTFICLLGKNGAGKSTLFQLIAGHIKPSQGSIFIGDQDTTLIRERDTANHFAVLPQGVSDPPYLNVRELVALGRFRASNGLGWRPSEADLEIADKSLTRCEMEHMSHRTFQQLSGGEKQRSWLAFCLAQEKEFLLLDESLHALDFEARRTFFRLLSDLATEGRGILLTTHDMDLAEEFASRLLVLQDSTLGYDGPPPSDIRWRLTT